MSAYLRILVTGKSGRMGQTIIACAQRDPEVDVVATHDVGEALAPALEPADTVIDFTIHGFTPMLVDAAVATGKRLVIGTTGHNDGELGRIREAATVLPVVFAPNFSVGVNTLFWLTRQAVRILGPSFDLEVVEMHHRHKQDAPSGTARRLVEILCQERHLQYREDVRHGRVGDIGARPRGEIGLHSLRGGDAVGDHTVVFAESGDRLELTHKATSRDTFALGAIRAAKWLADKPAGLYDMEDVLGLRSIQA